MSRLRAPRGFPWAEESSIAFIHVDGKESQSGSSFYNEAEAKIVCTVRDALLQGRSVGREDIGVLTFYDAQNKCVTRSCDMRGTTVANVDGFQGSERPVMILSTVRTTRTGHIGFTKDPRRINVALTRAQRGLIVIGDFHALHAGDTYGH